MVGDLDFHPGHLLRRVTVTQARLGARSPHSVMSLQCIVPLLANAGLLLNAGTAAVAAKPLLDADRDEL